MTKRQTLQHIILPQAMALSLPSLGNELIILLKDSSLASIIGVVELTKEGSIIRSQTYDPFMVLLMVSALYFLMTFAVSYYVPTTKS